MIENILLQNGNILYRGSIFGFNYEKELENDLQFELWLEAKLLRYKFKPMELKIINKILGVTDLENRLKTIEEKLK